MTYVLHNRKTDVWDTYIGQPHRLYRYHFRYAAESRAQFLGPDWEVVEVAP